MLYFLWDQNNKMLSGTLTELQNINNGRGSIWIKNIEQLITRYNLELASRKSGTKN